MRVLHVPYSFYPDPVGGTEVYVNSLASAQRETGSKVAIAAPGPAAYYEHDGIPVWRFAVSAKLSLRELYGEGDAVAAEAFGGIVDEFRPDIVHLHAVTSAISARLARQAADRGIPLVLTYHTPTVSCARGTLLRCGTEICDGVLDRRRCTACALQEKGLPIPLAKGIASLSFTAIHAIGEREGGVWTALRMPELIELQLTGFRRVIGMVGRVVALCDWTRDLLVRNGVPEEKLILCRHGIVWNDDARNLPDRSGFRLPLRVAFLGRLDATKGVDVLVRALRSDPDLPVRLDLYGVRQGEGGNRFAADLERMIAGDPRIRILPAIPSEAVVTRLREYDMVVVPSQWLETGPLVVLEAFAAGVPVIGSKLGGIAELVTDGVDGLLVEPYGSTSAWADAMRRATGAFEILNSMRGRIRRPRSSRQVATEMAAIYGGVRPPSLTVATHDISLC